MTVPSGEGNDSCKALIRGLCRVPDGFAMGSGGPDCTQDDLVEESEQLWVQHAPAASSVMTSRQVTLWYRGTSGPFARQDVEDVRCRKDSHE